MSFVLYDPSAVLSLVPPREALAFRLCYQEGFTQRAAAVFFPRMRAPFGGHISTARVHQLCQRALNRLRHKSYWTKDRSRFKNAAEVF